MRWISPSTAKTTPERKSTTFFSVDDDFENYEEEPREESYPGSKATTESRDESFFSTF